MLKTTDGRTPLYISVDFRAVEVAILLIDLKADVNLAKENGRTPLLAAAQKNFSDVTELLLKNGADTEKNDVSTK